MPDFTDLPDGAVGAGGLPSGETVTALRDNALASVEGKGGVLHAAAWNLVEIQEPTSDVSAVTFAYDITGMRDIMVGFVVEPIGNGNWADFQVRASGGTWRTVARSVATDGHIGGNFIAENISNTDGTNLIIGHALTWQSGTNLDRSNSAGAIGTSPSYGGVGSYSSYNEVIAECRVIKNSGSFEFEDADRRGQFRLYVCPQPTREATL